MLSLAFLLLGFTGALASFLIYACFAAWWRNPVGRFLVAQAFVIAAVYGESVGVRVLHLPLPGWVAIATNAVVAALMVYHAVTFAWLIRADRKERR